MRTAEPRKLEFGDGMYGKLMDTIEHVFNNDYEFSEYSPDELESQYDEVKEEKEDVRYLKDAALHLTSISYDALVDGEIDRSEFEDVLDNTREHIRSYYFGERDADELFLEVPDIDGKTRQFSRHGEAFRRNAMEELADILEENPQEYHGMEDPDRVVGVPGGGIEPGLIASEALGKDVDLIRASPRKRGDEEAVDWKSSRDYEGESVLVLDDIKEEGRAENAITDYLEQKGAEEVEFIPVLNEY
jgi:adenine/guanine phosphoribosyltransferase-like PRPP-binding protein